MNAAGQPPDRRRTAAAAAGEEAAAEEGWMRGGVMRPALLPRGPAPPARDSPDRDRAPRAPPSRQQQRRALRRRRRRTAPSLARPRTPIGSREELLAAPVAAHRAWRQAHGPARETGQGLGYEPRSGREIGFRGRVSASTGLRVRVCSEVA